MAVGHDTKILLDVAPATATDEGPKCPACDQAFGKNTYRNPQFIKMVEQEFPSDSFPAEALETCFKCLMDLNFQRLGKTSLKTISILGSEQ